MRITLFIVTHSEAERGLRSGMRERQGRGVGQGTKYN
jgi:hypothetical protein